MTLIVVLPPEMAPTTRGSVLPPLTAGSPAKLNLAVSAADKAYIFDRYQGGASAQGSGL